MRQTAALCSLTQDQLSQETMSNASRADFVISVLTSNRISIVTAARQSYSSKERSGRKCDTSYLFDR